MRKFMTIIETLMRTWWWFITRLKCNYNHNGASLILIVVIIDFSSLSCSLSRLNQLKEKKLAELRWRCIALEDIWLPYFCNSCNNIDGKLKSTRKFNKSEFRIKDRERVRERFTVNGFMTYYGKLCNQQFELLIMMHFYALSSLSVTYFCILHDWMSEWEKNRCNLPIYHTLEL